MFSWMITFWIINKIYPSNFFDIFLFFSSCF
nr:MAG TPA: hypothetical protein [Inoviridae sp.]